MDAESQAEVKAKMLHAVTVSLMNERMAGRDVTIDDAKVLSRLIFRELIRNKNGNNRVQGTGNECAKQMGPV
jgi:hypothetical protein